MVTKEQLFTGEEKNMIVYHYCSLESLNSILKNRSLRLTNILKSNDSMEISWICRYYDAEFKRAYENASDLFRSKISSERLMGYVKLFTDEFFNENHADFRYYVTCFRIRMICSVSGGDMRMTGAELPSDLTWMY